MVRDPIKEQAQPVPALPAGPAYRQRWWSRWSMLLLLGGVILVTVASALIRLPSSSPHAKLVPMPTPTFVPKVGDVGDLDDGITVALGQTPAFQFEHGGYTLSGITVDARTGRPLGGISVWVTLPPVSGRPTAPALRSVSTLDGAFTFLHLAAGTYNLAAARYYTLNGQQFIYPEVVRSDVRVPLPQHATLQLALQPQAAPGQRRVSAGVARNLIMLDLRGIYAESWFADPALQGEAQNMRELASGGAQAANVVAPYGWHPADQYALLSGSYPAWRVYDPWPYRTAWGTPDGIDTTFWYNADPMSLTFGQESLFDVARGYGMSTAALGGPQYALSDVSTRGVQTAQVGLTFDSANWLATAQHLIETMADNPNGFVFYSELDPPFGSAAAAGAAPDAPGGAYARAMQADDELIGLLRHWLASRNLLSQTLLLVTASEAQVNETVYDNYYGMGPDGRGSSLHVPFVLAGEGIRPGMVDAQTFSSFAVAATALRGLCLPAPASSRAQALTMLFDNHCP